MQPDLLPILRAYAEECFACGTTPRVSELAQRLRVSPGRLTQRFGCVNGCTIGTYLKQLQIARAKELLQGTREPISMVATESGFSSTRSFSRLFQQMTGDAPASYRAKVLSLDKHSFRR